MPKNWECNPKRFCHVLNSRLQETNKKGFVLYCLTDIKTGKTTRRMPGYKTQINDKGMVLNYCPFCGTELFDGEGEALWQPTEKA